VSDPSGVIYQIQIDNDADFGSPVYYAVDLTDNTHTLTDENALGMFIKYFWRVRAKDGAGNIGDWSEEWNFTVVPVGAIYHQRRLLSDHLRIMGAYRARIQEDRAGAGVGGSSSVTSDYVSYQIRQA
jgi:hypothetical protein